MFTRPVMGRNAARAADICDIVGTKNEQDDNNDQFFQAINNQFSAQTQMMGSHLDAQTKNNDAATNLQIIDKLMDLLRKKASAPLEDHVICDESIAALTKRCWREQ